MIAIARPLVGDEEAAAVLHVLESGQLAQGEQVATFERRFAEVCQVGEAVAVSSGTAALHLALLAHGVGPGDEVITSPFSFAATTNAILLVGATPVFVDIEAETFTIDPGLVEAAITRRTKAILPVHLYGHPCDMPRLMALAAAYDLSVIEDACQAHAAAIDGKPVGGFGTGCFSFYPTKNITTAEGGMVTTNDPQLAERVRLLRNHGQRERYRHLTLGYNLRMTELQGALGVVQVGKLERFTQQRISNAAFLSEHLADVVQTPMVKQGYRHVYHQYTIRVPEQRLDEWADTSAVGALKRPLRRDEWVSRLGVRGVGSAIHYPCPIHMQPFYREAPDKFRIASPAHKTREEYPMKESLLPVAEEAAQQVLSLPVHPALTAEELETIVQEVRALCR